MADAGSKVRDDEVRRVLEYLFGIYPEIAAEEWGNLPVFAEYGLPELELVFLIDEVEADDLDYLQDVR
jgi:hypothetical protein